MGLSTQQMARLSELLDQALPLTPAARRTWLAGLSSEDLPLVQSLREALQADDPDVASIRSLDQPPAMDPGAGDSMVTEHHAGERLGAYELQRPLGAGGMAEVWLARRADGAFERRVALKIPRLSHVPVEMAERFARECRILATLEFPGIARLYDAGVEANRTPYIAMEYVQGEPLIAWCDSRGLEVRARIDLFLQVLDAVGYAHARGIVHRDLKPSNILVTGQGEVRLLDFGVASLLQADPEPRSLTRIYGPALTPEYASPESLRGERADVRSDIYSLGAVLHELLTGARPGREPPDNSLSAGLREILAKTLATSPADRYPDVATFAAALRRGSGSAAPFRKTTARYVVASAAVMVVAIGATSYYWMHAASRSAPPANVETAPRGTATIAVLPFVDLSEQQDRGYLSDGLAEELIDLLTKIPQLRVTARASSFAFRDRQAGVAAIARQLNVDNVLDGSVRSAGSRLKFTVQLVRTSDGTVDLVRDLRPGDERYLRDPGKRGGRRGRRAQVAPARWPGSVSRTAHAECPRLRGVSPRPAVSGRTVTRAISTCAGGVRARRGARPFLRTRACGPRTHRGRHRRDDHADSSFRPGARRGRAGHGAGASPDRSLRRARERSSEPLLGLRRSEGGPGFRLWHRPQQHRASAGTGELFCGPRAMSQRHSKSSSAPWPAIRWPARPGICSA